MCPLTNKRERGTGRTGSAWHITRPGRCGDSLRSEFPNGGFHVGSLLHQALEDRPYPSLLAGLAHRAVAHSQLQ